MLKIFKFMIIAILIAGLTACGGSKDETVEVKETAVIENAAPQDSAEVENDEETEEAAKPKRSVSSAEWKADMTSLEAIAAADAAIADKYPDAEVFKIDLRYTKRGGKFIISYKINDTQSIKVDVDFNGKTKINDKKGEFFAVPKGSVKDQSALPAPKPRATRKKAAAADEE